MDYQEAIEIFENEIRRLKTHPIHVNHLEYAEKAEEALKKAITAMQELQALHNQGLILERLKDIDFRDKVIGHINYKNYMSVKDDLEDYQQIGTLDEVREAVKKQNAKKPTYDGDGYAPDGTFVWDEWLCPHCGTIYEVDYDDYDYCPKCGQHIDWSGEE